VSSLTWSGQGRLGALQTGAVLAKEAPDVGAERSYQGRADVMGWHLVERCVLDPTTAEPVRITCHGGDKIEVYVARPLADGRFGDVALFPPPRWQSSCT
jgi:hypothetical protein